MKNIPSFVGVVPVNAVNMGLAPEEDGSFWRISGLEADKDAFSVAEPKLYPPGGACSVYPAGILIITPPAPTPCVFKAFKALARVAKSIVIIFVPVICALTAIA